MLIDQLAKSNFNPDAYHDISVGASHQRRIAKDERRAHKTESRVPKRGEEFARTQKPPGNNGKLYGARGGARISRFSHAELSGTSSEIFPTALVTLLALIVQKTLENVIFIYSIM